MTDLRSRPAYISVAATSRTITPRRVVELSEPAHHLRPNTNPASDNTSRDQEALTGFSSHGAAGTDRAVKASPPGGLRPALTALPPSAHAPENNPDEPEETHLTSRPTSVPGH
jgi:hypothetical protein